MAKKPVSFTDYLRVCRRENFFEQMSLYCRENPRAVRGATGAPDGTALRLLSVCTRGTESAFCQSLAAWQADVLVLAVFRAVDEETPTGKMSAAARLTALFRFRYFLDLRPERGECCGPVIAPAACFPRDSISDQDGIPVNAWLLPVLRKEDYDRAAAMMLERFCPGALRRRKAVDGRILAYRMGLQVRRVRLEEGSRALGRIFFDEARVTLRDERGEAYEETVAPFTVLLNRDLCRTAAEENRTLLHECAHAFLDLPFFMLQKMAAGGCSAESLRGRRAGTPLAAVDWMELQAAKLPVHLMMEAGQTRREIAYRLRQPGGGRSPENLNRVLDRLVSLFGVTRSMARLRMIELGYPEAEGVCAWVDGKRLPDFSCAGRWLPGRHYAVSFSDACRACREDAALAAALNSGAYVYVEGHFCLRDPRYVVLEQGRPKRMTALGRSRVDECCIAFRVRGGHLSAAEYEGGRAAKMQEVKDHYLHLSMDAEPGTVQWNRENSAFADEARRWSALRRRIAQADSTRAAVDLIRREKGLSWDKLALEVGVSRPTLMGWLDNPRISLRQVTALCVALRLRGDVGRELVRVSECSVRTVPARDLYLSMVEMAPCLTVERCNAILQASALPPLHYGDMLAG